MKKPWYEVVKDALAIYLHNEQYCYFYGAKGIRLTDENMRYLISVEPAHFKQYTDDPVKLKALLDYSRGKIGYDCSGFTSAVTGCNMYSTGQINICTNVTDEFKCTAGSILYTTFGGTGRHVGLDIGYGYSLSFNKEMETCKLQRHKENPNYWEKGGQLTGYVDYTGADNR